MSKFLMERGNPGRLLTGGCWLLLVVGMLSQPLRGQDGEGGFFFGDTGAGNFAFTTDDYVTGELDGSVSIRVTRQGGARGKVLVDYMTTDTGTAMPMIDFIPASGTLEFVDFQTAASFSVTILSDGGAFATNYFSSNCVVLPELEKTIGLALSNPRRALGEDAEVIIPGLGFPSESQVTINEVRTYLNFFSFERANYRVSERVVGETLTIAVLLPGGVGGMETEVSVDVDLRMDDPGFGFVGELHPGSVRATPGGDYTPNQLITLNFPPGTTRRTFDITIINDPNVEFNEDILMRLRNPRFNPADGIRRCIGPQSEARATILFDDDPAGALDEDWNPDGVVQQTPPFNPNPGANNEVNAVAIQPDGRAVVGGQFTAMNTIPRNGIARLLANGFLDLSFNPGSGANGSVEAILLYPPSSLNNAGKMLVVGGFSSFNGIQRKGIVRLNPDGSVDSGFNPGNGADGFVFSAALQADEKVVIGGTFASVNGVPRFGVARLEANGALDPTFDPGSGADGTVFAVSLDALGRVVLGGDFFLFDGEFHSGVVRLTSSGALDPAFNAGGGADDAVLTVVHDAAGAIVLGGAFGTMDLTPRSGIARLNPDGSLDETFDPGAGVNDSVFTVVLQPDGRLLLGGVFTEINHTRRVGIARLYVDGTVDTSFLDTAYNHFAGFINDFSFPPANFVSAIGIEPGGDLIVGGKFLKAGGGGTISRDQVHPRYNVVRLLGGETVGPGNFGYRAASFTVDEHGGQLFVPMTRLNGGLGFFRITQSTTEGLALDGVDYNGFVGTLLAFPFSGTNTTFYTNVFPIVIIDDELVEGNETFGIQMFNPSVELVHQGEVIPTGAALHRSTAVLTIIDNDFRPGRFAFSEPAYFQTENQSFATITVQRLGGDNGSASVEYITVGGTASAADFTPRNRTLLFASGQTERTFAVPIFNDTDVEDDETVFLVLSNATGGAALDFSSVDPSFNPGLGANDEVLAMDVDGGPFSSGRVAVAGSFSSFNGVPRNRIALLNRDGSLATFFAGKGTDGDIHAVVLHPDNSVIIGGEFSAADGMPANRLARLNGDGSLDVAFAASIGAGPNGTVMGLAIQQDGSVLVVGDFTEFDGDGSYQRVVRLTPGGSVDASFGPPALGAVVRTVAVLSDGRIVLGGDFPGGLVLLGNDGAQTGGFFGLNGSVNAVAVQADDAIIAGGDFIVGGHANIARFLPSFLGFDGTFDPGVGTDGPVLSVDYQPIGNDSGKVVIGGAFSSFDGVPCANLARLNADGSIDETFRPVQGPNGPVRAVELQNDLKLVVAGGFSLINNLGRNGIARLSSASSVLTIIDDDFAPGRISFASLGYAINESGGSAVIAVRRSGGTVGALSVSYIATNGTAIAGVDYSAVTNVLVWGDGDSVDKTFTVPIIDNNLVEGGKTVNLALFNPSIAGALGSVSNAVLTIENDDFPGILQFSSPAYTVTELSGTARITVTRSSGLAGPATVDYEIGGPGDTAITGLDYVATDGTLTFASGQSSQSFSISIPDDDLQDGLKTLELNLVSSTGAVLGGRRQAVLFITDNESSNLPAGSPDTTFDAGGADEAVFAIGVEVGGRILIGGDFQQVNGISRNRIARVDALGNLDPLFNAGSGPNAPLRTLGIQSNGKIVIGGFFTSVNGTNRSRVARLNTDGSVDSFFDPGAGADNAVYSLAIGAEGRIVIGGAFTGVDGVARPRIAQLQTNGTVNLAFNTGVGPNDTVFAVAIQADGKVLIGGDFTTVNNVSRPRIARLNSDGSLDLSFNPGAGADEAVRSILVQTDGKVLIGGSFTSVAGTPRNNLARLNPNGSLDGGFLGSDSGGNNPVFALSLQTDEKIVVVGDFTQFNGVTRNRVTRLTQDGTTDTTINFGAGANGFVAAVATQADGEILIGGGFTKVNNLDRVRIARLHGGSIEGAGRLEFSSPGFSVDEFATNAFVTIRRTGGTAGTVGVVGRTSAGTAVQGSDYSQRTNTFQFPPGETTRTFLIPIIDDNFVEEPETFNVTLSDPTGGATLGSQPATVVTIFSEDAVIGFNTATFAVNEDTISGRATIVVRRSGGTNTTVAVNYATTLGGTALVGQDFAAVSGALVFAPGVTEQSFFVPLTDDSVVEGSETVGLSLSSAAGSATIGQATAVLTIVDNDFAAGALTYSSADYPVDETAGTVTITVNRVAGITGVVSVDYSTTQQTATSDLDFIPVSGNLTFADGQVTNSFTITILADLLIEPLETIGLVLSNPTGGAALGGNTTARVTIVNVGGLPQPGTLDPSFDPGAGANNLVRTLALQPDGKLVVGGAFSRFDGEEMNFVARLDSDGGLDSAGFDSGGGPDGLVSTVALQQDGRVLLGGAFLTVDGLSRIRTGRLDASGALDLGFLLPLGVNAIAYAIAGHTDGGAEGVLVAGQFDNTPSVGIVRLNADGTLDTRFDAGIGADGPVYALAVQADNGILVAGAFTGFDGEPRGGIARLRADGSLDPGFTSAPGANGPIYDVKAGVGGRIIIAGDFSEYNGVPRGRVARLHADGSLDTDFAPVSGADDTLFTAAVQEDGRVLIGGDFGFVNGLARNRFARLNSDGSLDGGFLAGSGADGTVYSILVQPDLRIVLGGDFSLVNGVSRNGVARLHGDPANPSSPFSLSSITVATNGHATLVFETIPGFSYLIEGSGDLGSWTGLTTINATGASASFTDTNAPALMRFYRVQRVDQ